MEPPIQGETKHRTDLDRGRILILSKRREGRIGMVRREGHFSRQVVDESGQFTARGSSASSARNRLGVRPVQRANARVNTVGSP
jgi:hypothetical protein